jgi:single-strand DNA-binding protein
MKLINELHISGRVGSDPEQKGNGPTRFRLAHGGGKKKDGSDWPTQWFTVVSWDVAAVPTKGKRVEVWGKLRDASWTDKEGVKRTAVEIVADAIQQEEECTPASRSGRATTNLNGLKVTDDDIPF